MLYLKEGEFHVEPEVKVLKAGEYGAKLKGEEIIALAQKKGEEIIAGAEAAFEAEKERGFKEGMEAGNQEISELMIETVSKGVKNFEQFENALIDVVIDALRKILGDVNDKELVTRVVRNSLEKVRNQKRVTVMVNPEDIGHVKEKVAGYLKEFPGVSYIEVEGDSRIGRGGCMIQTEVGVVDATLEVQLAAIKRSLSKLVK